MSRNSLIGMGRKAMALIADADSFEENVIQGHRFEPDIGPCAVIGTGTLEEQKATLIANDARVVNPRFKVVFAGLIGLEEAYKMAIAVYWTIESDADKPPSEKRPIVALVDTPGNGAGKKEEILGIHKATGEYQLALAKARKIGHPVLAVIIGRAISGGFLCHGLQADRIISLSKKFNTMIHVMPLTSISRITKIPMDNLEILAKDNPVFAAGVDFFYRLGGVEEIVEDIDHLRRAVLENINAIRAAKAEGRTDELGPWGRGLLGQKRGGRQIRAEIIDGMDKEFEAIASRYI